MSVIDEIIRINENNSISFGNYTVKEKKKVSDFEVNGDYYKVKTHDALTRLEKNGKLLYESVPGSAVHNFKVTEKNITFTVEGNEAAQITLELEPDKEYKIFIDDFNVGKVMSGLAGKISFSAELKPTPQGVKIEKS